jgi:ribosomal protein S27AE
MMKRDSGFGTRDSALRSSTPRVQSPESGIPSLDVARDAVSDSRRAARESRDDETTCPQCGESHDLAKVKGCIKCLKCGFKFDCNGW